MPAKTGRTGKYTGKKFGYLTALVTAKIEGKSWTRYGYLCECVCGKQVKLSLSVLTSGARKSCGCKQYHRVYEDGAKSIYIGRIIGSFTVIDTAKIITANGKVRYGFLCECKCGKRVVKHSSCIHNESLRSCGCGAHKEKEGVKK